MSPANQHPEIQIAPGANRWIAALLVAAGVLLAVSPVAAQQDVHHQQAGRYYAPVEATSPTQEQGSYAPSFLHRHQADHFSASQTTNRQAFHRPSTNQPATIETETPVRQTTGQQLPSPFPVPRVDGDGGYTQRAGVKISTDEYNVDEINVDENKIDENKIDQTFTLGGPVADSEPMADDELVDFFADQADKLTSREGTGTTIKVALLLTALSLAPALILMTTSYVRVVVVLSLLRQAFGGQQLPPTQVLTALSLFITLLVMAPVWNEIKKEAIDPYTSSSQDIDWQTAWDRGVVPVRNFMIRQIQAAKNENTVAMFYKYAPDGTGESPQSIDDVPLSVLLPSFMISELKVAFLLGFQIYLPFLIVDLVVSSVTVSMGMLMLPPTMVSFPLKLILFVMVDGWSLVVGMLLQSFAPYV